MCGMSTDKIFTVILIFLCSALSFFIFMLSSVSNGAHYSPVEIPAGSGFKDIAAVLAEKNIVRSKNAFIIYGALSGSAHQLKPGNYLLSSGSSTPVIVWAIKRGPTIDKSIFIPEGATVRDIDNILSEAGVLPAGTLVNFNKSYEVSLRKVGDYEFLRGIFSLEGFLFPDTYRFFKNTSAEAVLKKFLDNFQKKAWPILEECQKSKVKCQMSEAGEILIIASLLEKEAPDYEDRRMIAGVLYKRLEIGMGLQVDATIVYAKCGGLFITCGSPRVLKSDLAVKSLYNTYLYRGLPPGPIGNPGLDAIKAALNPIASEYIYYLSDPKTKKTIFSKTLDEHNDNRVKYLGN